MQTKNKNLIDNINDLPKWAQSEIRVLQMRLNEARTELERINTNEPSNTICGSSYTFGDEKIKYLKNNQRITFVLSTGEIQAHISDDAVEIHSTPTGRGDMYIRPHVSNVVTIHLK